MGITQQAVTWPLSGFGDEIDDDPAVQIAVLQSLGAHHIEVRSAWGINIVDSSEEQLQTLAELLAEKKMKVSAIASPVGKVDIRLPLEGEVERLRLAVRAAEVLGAKYVRIFSFYYGDEMPIEDVRNNVLERMRALASSSTQSKAPHCSSSL